jgi:hypothetical protein
MAKRFTDSRKWDDEWFLGLSNDYRLVWLYLLDKCDYAGIFKPNIKLLNFCLGSNHTIDDLLQVFKERLVLLESGKLFIPKFISFQYKELNYGSPFHNKLFNTLRENRVSIEYLEGINTPKDKVKEKDKVKDKVNREDFNKILFAFIDKKGYTKEDIDLSYYYRRYSKTIYRLLDLAKNKADKVLEAIELVGDELNSKKLHWEMETIEKRWADFMSKSIDDIPDSLKKYIKK